MKSNQRMANHIYVLAFLGPCVAYVVIWRVLPLIYTGYLSLTSWNLIHDGHPSFVGLANYRRLLADPLVWHSLWITVLFTVVSTAVQLTLGTGIAILLDREIKGKALFRVGILIPMVLTPVVVGTIWYILFHNTLGPINYVLKSFGIKGINWLGAPQSALISVIISDIWQWMPFMFMIVYAALQSIPSELYEAAKVDGAAGFRLFWNITLPVIRHTAIISFILRSMDAFREFDKVFVMTGGGPGSSTELASVLIYKSAFQYFEMGYSATLVVAVLLLSSVIYSLYLRHVEFEGF